MTVKYFFIYISISNKSCSEDRSNDCCKFSFAITGINYILQKENSLCLDKSLAAFMIIQIFKKSYQLLNVSV